MIRKSIVNMIVISALIMTLTNSIISKSYASVDKNKTEYVISQSEESEFLENIYKTETDMLKIKNITKEETENNYTFQEQYETKVLDSNNTQYIYEKFGRYKEFNNGEYKGTLEITDIDIETIENGYYEKIDEQVFEFSDYTDNDLYNIEKEILIDNSTYYLINVEWEPDTLMEVAGEQIPQTYKGKKIYQSIQKINNPNTYKITVTYTGETELIDKKFEYTIFYEEVADDNKEIEENIENIETTNIITPIIISGAGVIIILMWLYNNKKFKKSSKKVNWHLFWRVLKLKMKK